MKTKTIITLLLIILSLSFIFENQMDFNLYAQTEFENIINEQIQDLEIENLNDILNNENFSFTELFNDILNGNFKFNINEISNYVINILKNESQQLLSTFILIFVICILGYILSTTASSESANSIKNVIHLGLMGIVISLIITFLFNSILDIKNVFSSLQKIMETSFPILLTLMASSGTTTSLSIMQPIMALLSGGIAEIFINILLPLFIVIIVITIADHLSSTVKLSHFSDFLTKSFKWALGVILGGFTALVGIFGVTANSYDSIAFKTAKYSIKNYIPFVGGFLSSGLNLITCSSILIKNALGLSCFVLTLIIILKPLFSILILKLFLSLLAAMLQNIADKKMTDFMISVSKVLNMLIAITVTLCAMFLIFLSLCIGVGNFI